MKQKMPKLWVMLWQLPYEKMHAALIQRMRAMMKLHLK